MVVVVTCDLPNEHIYSPGQFPQTKAEFKIWADSGSSLDVCYSCLKIGIDRLFKDASEPKVIHVEKI